MKSQLRSFKYRYDVGAGPLPEAQLSQPIQEGNCRLALQDYFYSIKGLYLPVEDILLPRAYKEVGEIVATFNGDCSSFFHNLIEGDIIYAQNFRNKKEEVVYKDRASYDSEDDYILHFHTAVYLGSMNKTVASYIPFATNIVENTPVIWHSSFAAGGTAVWPVEKFCYYYRPVAAKRINL